MSRFKILAVSCVLALFVLPISGGVGRSGGGAPPPALDWVPGEILIKLKDGASFADRQVALAQLGANSVDTFRSRAERWVLGPGIDVQQAVDWMNQNGMVEYAEPNYILTADIIPDDARFDEQWSLLNTGQTGGTPDADIDADMAWGVSTGSPNVVVGVIDTGVDYNHPDLAANIYVNPGEIPGNGLDDDNNGFIDDVSGWDFANDDNDPFDDNGHGTHTSGTIGAIGDNGIGVAGVNWHVKIMPLKFLTGAGQGTTADAVSAVDYATMMGIDLTSNSWGGGGYSQALYDAIAASGAANQLFIAAAGNNGTNSDTSPHYPSSYDLANIVSVAATEHNDQYASFSNYGAVSVDLAAPGQDVLSTLPGNSYGSASGTSMATPHVAGVAALIRAVSPGVPAAQVKSILMSTVDDITDPARPTQTNGRLNAFFAIAEPDDVAPAPINDLAAGTPTSNTIELSWTATGDDGAVGTASYYEVRYSTAPIDDLNWGQATRAGNEPTPAPSGSPQGMEVLGLEADTFYYFAIKAFDEWGNPSDVGPNASGTTLPAPTADADPTYIADSLLTGERATHIVTLANVGVGTLDYTIPTPFIGEPVAAQVPLPLGKDEPDPRSNDPVVVGFGGPDPFGYRWIDSDEPGGPAFSWIDISATGIPVDATSDDDISPVIGLSFDFPFYGQLFNSIRVCTNGWLSFTSSSTSYSNQPLPSSGAPENLVAPFWDDLNPGGATRIHFQSFGNYAIVQWTDMPRYSGPGTYTFQAILDSSGAITYQYLSVSTGDVASSTVGIQDGTKTIGLEVAFNQAYLHDNLAIRIAAIPQWLTVSPTSGRLYGSESVDLNVRLDASGLEGALYPGEVHILTNDPANPDIVVTVELDVQGAPDAVVTPASLDYGDTFLGIPKNRELTVTNVGTDVLHVTGITPTADLVADPTAFNLLPHTSQDVTVTWTPSVLGPYNGSVTIHSDDAGEPDIVVPVAGNSIPAPEVVVDPTSFDETLYTNQTVTRTLSVTNTGGSPLEILQAATDLGGASAVVANSNGTTGSGGPDAFGYKWSDSDDPGGPLFDWFDISSVGTQIFGSGVDDSNSGPFPLGFTFPFYGNNFSSVRVSSNGFLSFTSTSSDLSNSTLPGTGSPENLLAVFHDDLRFSSATATAHYYNDGSRFIVQYTDVQKYYSTGSLTFQVILYPSGKIVYQYLSMTGTLNSATIGIQNDTRDIGLQIAYNEGYVHDNLAIQIGTTPDWLVVTPPMATIDPGQTFDFDVAFDATDRIGGDYVGAVVLTTNIPTEPEVRVPATLHVIGVPVAEVIPQSYDYGTRYVGYSHLTSFRVVNTGTDVLNVADVVSTDPRLIVVDLAAGGGGEQVEQVDAAFSLPPGAARLFNLAWQPVAPGPLDAQVVIHSDDPVNPTLAMPVTGDAIPAPVAVWSPSSFSESLLVGDVVHRTLHLDNQGGSDLTFTTQLRDVGGAQVTVYPELKLGEDEVDPRPGVLGSGGPDAFGYKWSDSDEAGGPIFDWFDITQVGTLIDFSSYTSGQNLGPYPIGFDFPFYGDTFNEFRACSNGWLSFTDTSTDSSNDPLPSPGAPENLLAAFWDSMIHDESDGSSVYYYYDGSRTIIQYNNLRKSGYFTAPFFTFQIILYPNGNIVYQYLTLGNAPLNSHTIGIQNQAGDDGLTVVYNDDSYIHEGLAIRFRALDWLTVSPTSGVVPPGGQLDLDVVIDATSQIGGDYQASIDLTTNDPAHGLILVPVNTHVTGIPDIDVQPMSLTFPTTYVGFGSSLGLTIRNVGTDVLTITNATVSGDFSQSGLGVPVSLPVGGSIPVTVDFAPTTDGTRTGELALVSDDPDESPLVIPFDGEGLFPPEIGTDPSSLEVALSADSSATATLTIHNTGGSDLDWNAGTNLISGIGQVTVYEELLLAKEEPDPRPGILGTGGPDTFGYTWIDSDEPGGPVFNWVDISGVGTQVPWSYNDDANYGPIPIGFDFPFYGNSFNELRVVTNGWLSFTNTTTDYSNDPLPSSGGPENLLAVFWDDLVHRSGSGSEPIPSEVYYYNDGTRFIVQYNHMYRIANYSDDLNFQVILYPGGKIVYQYATMSASLLTSATIGIQNATKDDGLTVVFGDVYVHDNMAIEFMSIPEWVSLDTLGGTIPAGGSQQVTVHYDSSGLEEGFHEAVITLTSNDPYTPQLDVPVTMCMDATAPYGQITSPIDGTCHGPAALPVVVQDDFVDDYVCCDTGLTRSYVPGPGPGYQTHGDWQVMLTASDCAGNSASDSVSFTIDTVAPTVQILSPPSQTTIPDALPFAILFQATDADGAMGDVVHEVVKLDGCTIYDGNTWGDGDGLLSDEDLTLSWPELCRISEDCGFTSLIQPEIRVEAIDCGGNLGADAVRLDGSVSLTPGYCARIDLALENPLATVGNWGAVENALSYDMVRGDLATLSVDPKNVDLGPVSCIERASLDTTTAGFEDTAIPDPGQVFFYVVRANDGIVQAPYGYDSADRTRKAKPANGDCN